MSVTALPSWLAGRVPPRPRPRMRIPRHAKLRVFPFRRLTGATSPRYHPTGRCRHDCEHLAGLRPDLAQPWPALPCHDVTIALDERIATLGRALPRRRLPIFQWRHVGIRPSQRLTWSPRGRARWGFAPTSLGRCNGRGLVELRPDPARERGLRWEFRSFAAPRAG